MMLTSVYLGLSRPQYVSVPEGFLTALAGGLFQVDYGVDDNGLALAVAYESKAAGTRSSTLFFHSTKPEGDSARLFADALQVAGLENTEDQLGLARAVADAIAGVRAKDGKVRATIPLTVSLALAQDMRGLMGTKNPPDLAGILERFFQMGAPAGSDGQPGAAERWVAAVDHRRDIDRVIHAIDQAATQTFFASAPTRRESTALDGTTDDFSRTPFAWFFKTWTKLCSPEWVEALPARVWVDWANTVLRLAYGMGYLWEVAWYESVAKSVVSEEIIEGEDLLRGVGVLLPWKEQSAGVSLRDVSSSTKWRVMRSNGIRDHIRAWSASNGPFANVSAELGAMKEDGQLRHVLTHALTGPLGTNENLWEAIKYSLLTREGSGPDADHYGFLRKHGPRYSVPDPGIEWLAALSSLACPVPSSSTDVGQLLQNLRELGLQPQLGDLVSRLEQAGVARGSADADQAVEIRAAF